MTSELFKGCRVSEAIWRKLQRAVVLTIVSVEREVLRPEMREVEEVH